MDQDRIFKKYSKNRILKAKDNPFVLEKAFKLIHVSLHNMDKFEEKELIKNS